MNTIILYSKMFITVGISLYSTRLILNALGASDYGIYSVVGGIIAALSFLQTAMSAATQRYMSFYQGMNDVEKQETVFANSLFLHIVFAILIFIIMFLFRNLIFEHFLNIPSDRVAVAKYIYIYMSLSICCSIISVPLLAVLNAHENMLAVAIIGIIQSFLILILSIYISKTFHDRLIMYGAGMFIVNIVIFFIYLFYCLRKYSEVCFSLKKMNLSLQKELISFAGWNTFGALSGIAKTQGLGVVFNLFYGTVLNAAYGIASQISNQLSYLSGMMLKAINPQIMKSEGANNREQMLELSMLASKYGFFLVAILAIPVIFEAPAVLKVWLKNVPDYTIMFCRIILLAIMVNQLTIGLQSAIQAVGKIKFYMIFIGGLKILMIPIAVVLLYKEYSLLAVMFMYVFLELLAGFLRLLFLRKYGELSISRFIKEVFIKEFFPVIGVICTGFVLINIIDIEYRFVISIPIMILVFIFFIYIFGLSKEEKHMVKKLISNMIARIK